MMLSLTLKRSIQDYQAYCQVCSRQNSRTTEAIGFLDRVLAPASVN
jgi:hypothetical protein